MRKFLLKSAIALSLGLVLSTEASAQRGGGGPGGGGPGGGGGYTPEQVWQMYGGGTNSTIDLNKNPQTKAMMQSRGYTLPQDGIVRKDTFLKEVEVRLASRSSGGPSKGPGGGPPSMGGPPSTSAPGVIVLGGSSTPTPAPTDGGRDRGRGGDSGGGFGSGGFGGFGRGGESTARKEDIEDERPNVLRYGKLPTKDLPSWFIELDTDKDGQVGLYEWRSAKKDMDEFGKYDLNFDGFVTAEELLRGRGVDTVAGGSKSSSGGNPFTKSSSGSNNSGSDMAADRIKSQDKDGDGKVSKAEADDRLRKNFDTYDINKDGFVDLEEYRAAYSNNGSGKKSDKRDNGNGNSSTKEERPSGENPFTKKKG